MIELIDVHAGNVEQTGFFCMRSKPKSGGYRSKLEWLKARFAEGMKIKIIQENGQPKGFVEYIPSEYAWRAVEAENYMIIHCLWVVGRGKGKGYGSRLLKACMDDAQAQGKAGVAAVTSRGTWLTDPSFFVSKGFRVEAEAPPAFELVVKRFFDAPSPRFPDRWDERAGRYGDGLTILRSDQCPYNDQAVDMIREAASELGIEIRVSQMTHCRDAQGAPSAYGTFQVIYNGKLLTYHPMTKRELLKLLQEAR